MGWFVALGFLINNFITAFQLKDLDWFLFIILSHPQQATSAFWVHHF